MVATPMSLVQNIGFVFIQFGEDASSKRTNVRAHHWSRFCGLGGRVVETGSLEASGKGTVWPLLYRNFAFKDFSPHVHV